MEETVTQWRGSPLACTVCGEEKETMFRCSRCSKGDVFARYCSRDCQRRHWPRHRTVCGSADPCPLCLERAEDGGAHVLCFACGFASCETCKPRWRGGFCPKCRADQLELKDRACLLRKVVDANPEHTIANYRLGLYYLRGREGVAKNVDKALQHLEKAFEKGISDAGVPIYNIRKDRGEVALAWLAKAMRVTGKNALSDSNRKSIERDLRPMLERMHREGQIQDFSDASVAEFLDSVEGAMSMPPAPAPSPEAPAPAPEAPPAPPAPPAPGEDSSSSVFLT